MKRVILCAMTTLALGCVGDDDDPIETGDDTGDVECTDVPFTGSASAAADQNPPDADFLVALNRIDLDADDFLLFLPEWQAPADARLTAGGTAGFSFCLPVELPDESYTTDGTMDIAMYLVGAYVDSNANDRPDSTDAYISASFNYLANVRGTPTAEFTNAGGEVGWNLLDFDPTNGTFTATPTPDAIADYSLPANLLVQPAGALQGTIVPELGPDTNIAITHTGPITGESDPTDPQIFNTSVDASAAGSTLSIDSLTPGGETHFANFLGSTPLLDTQLALYAGVAYTDTDANGQWELGVDTTLASTTAGPSAALIGYLKPTGFRAVTYLDTYGLGWTLFTPGGGQRDWADGIFFQ